jgi:hypothetical protein
MIEVFGKGSVARLLKDSESPSGHRLTTMEIEVSRIVWCEFLTHGMLARNAHSSRAIPFDKMVEQLKGKPVRFGQANKGMQDKGEEFDAPVKGHKYEPRFYTDDGQEWHTPQQAWELAKRDAIKWSRRFYEAGYHKQVYNRLTEPFQMIKAVVSATEWDNYYWLRDDVAADPTLHDLASTMRKAHEQSVPQLLQPGEWHLPYIEDSRDSNGNIIYWIDGENGDPHVLTLEEAIKVSSARTGAVSFRNTDYNLERSLGVYERLVGDDRKHASAMQHQATPMQESKGKMFIDDVDQWVNHPYSPLTWEPGISHADRDGNLWSAQFCGWIMHRKLISGENYKAAK